MADILPRRIIDQKLQAGEVMLHKHFYSCSYKAKNNESEDFIPALKTFSMYSMNECKDS